MPPPRGDGSWYSRGTNLLFLVLAVRLSVVPARLGMVMFGVAGVAVGGVGMMRRLLVIAGLVVLRRFTMMLGRVLVMVSGFLMVLNALVLAHVSSRSDSDLSGKPTRAS